MTSSALNLARDLKSRSREQLIALLTERPVSGTTLRDFFDLADALLQRGSIMDALARVPRVTVVRVAEGNLLASDQLLHRLGLATELPDGTFAPMDEVTSAARELCALPAFAAATAPVAESLSVETTVASETDAARIALERGLVITSAIDDLAQAFSQKPARRMATGLLSAADTARITLTVEHVGLMLGHAMDLAVRAQLIHLADGWWMPAPGLAAWRTGGPAQRWVALAFAWRESLDPRVAELLTARAGWGSSLIEFAQYMFPLAQDWIIGLTRRAVADAATLGLTANDMRLPLTAEILNGDRDAVTKLALASLPEPIDIVYVQNDLTIVAPGLLRPDDEALLRRICDVENAGLASTFRVSAQRLNSALIAGLSVDEILASLERLSATPLPQPVVYLITDTGAKFGAIRVRSWGGGSLVSCRDSHLLDLLLADSSLAVLTWERVSDTTATTTRDPSTTRELLVAEKHPAVCEDDDGNVEQTIPTVVLPVTARAQSVPAVHTLVDKLITSTSTETGSISHLDDGAAWRERQVSLAIRQKAPLTLTFGMPDGSKKVMTVIPLSVSNGRLRAKDATTDVERTLPMASIVTLATPVA